MPVSPRVAEDVRVKLTTVHMRAKLRALRQEGAGHFRSHSAFLITQILTHPDHLEEVVACPSASRRSGPVHGRGAAPPSIPGVDRPTAEVLIAEIGVDMSRFPSGRHLASWAGMLSRDPR